MSSKLPNRARLNLAAGLILSLVAYLILRQAIGTNTGALAIAEAIPVAWLASIALVRRRLEPAALVSVVVFGVALAITVLSGGKLAAAEAPPRRFDRRGGPCLPDLRCTLRKPLLIAALPMIARGQPERGAAIEQALRGPARRRTLTVATVIAG